MGFDIRKLEVTSTTGFYTSLAQVNLVSLNGLGISPRDGIIYGFSQQSHVGYLVRVSHNAQVLTALHATTDMPMCVLWGVWGRRLTLTLTLTLTLPNRWGI